MTEIRENPEQHLTPDELLAAEILNSEAGKETLSSSVDDRTEALNNTPSADIAHTEASIQTETKASSPEKTLTPLQEEHRGNFERFMNLLSGNKKVVEGDKKSKSAAELNNILRDQEQDTSDILH